MERRATGPKGDLGLAGSHWPTGEEGAKGDVIEREASKVIYDLQALKEEQVKKVTWVKEVNQEV